MTPNPSADAVGVPYEIFPPPAKGFNLWKSKADCGEGS
ncbi:hypothetical protein Rvan_2847 [Rhodomicrobium vannielii ATCC 17100]|uniref:Uncharacterized protein n=1 Tax=Rhodomicrobium vannielii (strain ATCC 17100 / DSM 162 / LMG 4299 / NCIMB 10020 / ATH 3.1.1) TaxID=648757 RepID=E3I8S6_RHOVT|nr:hypothetical protein Rvan_2847 [Rhodomicrobium vannielii ATCC 17100]